MQLQTREIVGQQPGPHLLITGGVHGDEFEPMAAVRRLMAEIDPQALRGKLSLVPIVNESAFRLGRRTGEDGKDLARTCPGREDGSLTAENIEHTDPNMHITRNRKTHVLSHQAIAAHDQ